MEELITLLIGCLILFLISFTLVKGDFYSPSFIVCSLFIIAVIMAIRDVISWDVSNTIFTFDATFILLSGLTVFVATECLVRLVVCNGKFLKTNKSFTMGTEKQPIRFSTVKKIVVLGSVVGFTFLYCIMMYRLACSNGYRGTFQLTEIAAFRHDISFDATRNYNIPRWIRMGKFGVDANVYVCIYILIRNIIYANDKFRNNIICIIVILCSLPTCIINSSRSSLLQMAGSAMLITYIMLRRRNDWRKPNKTFLKILRWSVIVFVVVITLFYLIQANGLFGRRTQRSLLDHVTMYIGAPVIHFYQFIQSPPPDVSYMGEETFAALNKTFVRLGIISVNSSSQLEMRAIGNHAGNIYTFFRRPYHDFGLIGMYIVTALTSGFFSYVYYKHIYRKPESITTDRCLVIYSYFFYIIYLVPMMCEICNLIYIGILLLVASIWFVYGILLNQIGIKKGRIFIRKDYYK